MATPEELARLYNRVTQLMFYGPKTAEDLILFHAVKTNPRNPQKIISEYTRLMALYDADVYSENRTQ